MSTKTIPAPFSAFPLPVRRTIFNMRLRKLLSRTRGVAILLSTALILGAVPTLFGQQDSCDVPSSVCDSAGFTFELIGFEPAAGTTTGSSTWTYEICVDSSTCPLPGGFHDLSHFDIVLPNLVSAGGCVSEGHQITLAQSDGEENVILECDGSTQDSPCGLTEVGKCNIVSGTLDDGECAQVKLTIAGEEVDLASGEITIVSKSATNCVSNTILGPSCESCDGTGGGSGACLTRTIGFWGTHPDITDDYLRVTACGEDLTHVDAGSCDSATEALCSSPGFEYKKNSVYVTMVRQLTAAKMNLGATADVGGGSCSDFEYEGQSIDGIITACEALCDADKRTISRSGCIQALDAFNNSEDTGFEATPEPFNRPGRAAPRECREAKLNRVVIGKDARRGNKGVDCSQ